MHQNLAAARFRGDGLVHRAHARKEAGLLGGRERLELAAEEFGDCRRREDERGAEKASTVGTHAASLSARYSCSSLMWPMPPSTVRRKVFGDLP